MRHVATCLCLVLVLSALTSVVVWAQVTAQINGTVKDASGAVLPGVEITVTQTETGISRNTLTDETGSYILPNLAVGPYRFEAALPGFRTYVQTGIVLQVNSSPVINGVMQVGQVTEHVEVQANAALVETRNVGVGQVIENQRILELPLNGRQVTDLITLAGAAVQLPFHKVDKSITDSNVDILVAGGLASGVAYRLDGANHNDPYTLNQLPLPFPDAMQEFKVETSALSAQSGLSSGASVAGVTKSGTNDFHGNLFEFHRNDLFNARHYFAEKQGTLKRNQFGGTLGGPIKRNKIFFFGGYQGTTIRSDPQSLKYYIPTAAMLAGDFTAFASPACNGDRAITLLPPFANNRVDPALFSPAVSKFVSHLPQTSDPCGLITTGSRRLSNEHQVTGKVDYQLSDRQSIFGRALIFKYKLPVPYSVDGNLLATDVVDVGSADLIQSYTLGHTYLISTSTVNTLRLAVNRSYHERINAKFFSAADIGIPLASSVPEEDQNVTMRVTGAFRIGNGLGPNVSTIYNATDDFSLIRGTHQIAMGVDLLYYRTNTVSLKPQTFGQYSFNGRTTGLPLADFLMGFASSFSQAQPPPYYLSQWFPGAYVADTWRIVPRLTLNYGVRWEPFLPQVVRNGRLVNFSEDRLKAGIKSTIFPNAPAGLYYPGDSGFPGVGRREDGTYSATGMNSHWGQFMPRLGLAWDVHGDGRMSLRASYAVAHDQVAAGFLTSPTDVPPYQPEITRNNVLVDNPWAGYPGGNPFPFPPPAANAEFPPLATYGSMPYDNPQMTRHMWNLSIQRQIATDWLVSASYIGSHALHLWYARNLNYAIYFPGNADVNGVCTQNGLVLTGGRSGTACSTTGNTEARRRLSLLYPNDGPRYSDIGQLETGGTQTYNGLLVSVQRRAASGLTVGGNWTWSHCYGNPINAAGGDNGAPAGPDPNNRDLVRGNCESDRRHIINVTSVAETPQFGNPTLRTLATGWRLSTIFRLQTGSWLTIGAGDDRALNDLDGQNAQQVLVDPYGDRKSLTNYLNPAAFALPALGTIGNMRPGNIEGPRYWGLDVALSRTFQFRESHRLEARFESFNVTNSLRRGNPDTNIASGSFGRILTAGDPRIMQFSMKYIF